VTEVMNIDLLLLNGKILKSQKNSFFSFLKISKVFHRKATLSKSFSLPVDLVDCFVHQAVSLT